MDSTWCACAGWSVGATRSRHAVAFPGMATNGQGFDVGRVQRLAPGCHCAGQRQHQWIQSGALAPDGRSVPPARAVLSLFPAWPPMGKGLILAGFARSRHAVILQSMATNGQGFDVGRVQRLAPGCHCAGQRQHQWIQPGALAPDGRSVPPVRAVLSLFPAWPPTGKGLMLEGFSGSRRVVTVLGMDTNDSTNGFNLVRLRRVVGRCHQITPCCRFSRHGHQWARV